MLTDSDKTYIINSNLKIKNELFNNIIPNANYINDFSTLNHQRYDLGDLKTIVTNSSQQQSVLNRQACIITNYTVAVRGSIILPRIVDQTSWLDYLNLTHGRTHTIYSFYNIYLPQHQRLTKVNYAKVKIHLKRLSTSEINHLVNCYFFEHQQDYQLNNTPHIIKQINGCLSILQHNLALPKIYNSLIGLGIIKYASPKSY